MHVVFQMKWLFIWCLSILTFGNNTRLYDRGLLSCQSAAEKLNKKKKQTEAHIHLYTSRIFQTNVSAMFDNHKIFLF